MSTFVASSHLCLVILIFIRFVSPQQVGSSCGANPSNTFCWYNEMDLSSPSSTSFTQNVFTELTGTLYLYTYFTPKYNDCLSPSLTVSYEMIDNDDGNEGLIVYDPNEKRLIACYNGKSCGSWYTCLNSYALGYVKWVKDNSYYIKIKKEHYIEAECGHTLTVNAHITINCAESTSPSQSQTNPTQYSSISTEPTSVVFPGYSLFVKGFNIFSTETSGNDILDRNYASNIESWTNDGAMCQYSSLEFDTGFSSYASYFQSDSYSVSLGFSTSSSSASGSLSKERTQTKEYSASSQMYIYTMDLKCISAQASVVSYDEIHWSSNFIKNLASLPTTFNSNDYDTETLNKYIDFWEAFGTHFIRSAKLGGLIKGALTVNKCNVQKLYSNSNAYQSCLNVEYLGANTGGCTGSGHSSTNKQFASDLIINQYIVVKGGDNSKFSDIFNSYRNKLNEFQEWINDLTDSPYIVGGNLVAIHDVIKVTIDLPNHKLNNKTTQHVHDRTWFQIANALQSAYNLYSKQLSENEAFTESECNLDCDEGVLDTMECVCNECDAVAKCCGINDKSVGDANSINRCIHFVICLPTLSYIIFKSF